MKNIKRIPALLIFSALFFILAIGVLVWPSQSKVEKTNDIKGAKIASAKKTEPTSTPTPTQQSKIGPTNFPSATPTPTIKTGQSLVNPTNTPAPQPTQVNLSINGSSVGQVSVTQGANQCDVLNSALSQGKIQSLNMRYENSFGTYGIYQINGVGKENSVWWTYTVNGQSPSQGCSYIKAASGDNVEWKYIGS